MNQFCKQFVAKNASQSVAAKRQILEDIFGLFHSQHVKPESRAKTEHIWNRLVFDPNTLEMPVFHRELNQGAENAFGETPE